MKVHDHNIKGLCTRCLAAIPLAATLRLEVPTVGRAVVVSVCPQCVDAFSHWLVVQAEPLRAKRIAEANAAMAAKES